jgi:hypothetical protein
MILLYFKVWKKILFHLFQSKIIFSSAMLRTTGTNFV